jgi:hypothetical protein
MCCKDQLCNRRIVVIMNGLNRIIALVDLSPCSSIVVVPAFFWQPLLWEIEGIRAKSPGLYWPLYYVGVKVK